jgi:hypothetical protein
MQNIQQLKQFYQTAQGKLVCAYLSKIIQQYFANHQHAQKILSIGYVAPYEDLLDNAINIIDNFSHLATIADNSIDQVLLMHDALAENLWPQIWRTLKPSGKLLLIAPNKFSLIKTCKLNDTKVFSLNTLNTMLRENLFDLQKITSTPLMTWGMHQIMPKIMPKECANIIENMHTQHIKLAGMFWAIEAQKLLALKIKNNLFNYQILAQKQSS